MFDFHYQLEGARRKSFKVQGDVCSIGSARNNDLVVSSRVIGKRHAELRLKSDGVHIRDLGSLSGCWVNSERVQEYGPLTDFDEVAVGDIDIVLRALSINHDADQNSAITNHATHGGREQERVEQAQQRNHAGTQTDLEMPCLLYTSPSPRDRG